MAKPLRILELRSVRGTGGGPEKTILLGAARSDPRRYEVTVCYIRDQRDEVFGIGPRALDLGVRYVELRERHSFDPGVWHQLRALVRDHRIDIVHSHEYKTNLLTLLLSRVEDVIPVSTAHGWTGHARRERALYYPGDKLLLRAFPSVIAVSGEIKRELRRWGCEESRVEVILNGIDHHAYAPSTGDRTAARRRLGVPEHAVLIGSVGRLERQKRFDVLIDAVWRLRRSGRGVRLVIAGEGSLRAELEAQIRTHGLEQHCRLAGHIGDVRAFYPALDLFVQSSDYEGTPNVVLEAMALQVPIVATQVGGTAELVRPAIDGVLVPEGSSTVLADAIGAALDDSVSARTRATNARLRVESELSFECRMRRLEGLYDRLARRRCVRTAAADGWRGTRMFALTKRLP